MAKKKNVERLSGPEGKFFADVLASRLPQRRVPEGSVLAKLLNLVDHPAVMVYGPTKAGKTRLVAWEAAAAAKALGSSVVHIFVEPNIEPIDIEHVAGACAYHGVPCKIVVTSDPRRVRSVIGEEKRLLSLKLRYGKDVSALPRVYVIDSVVALNKRIMAKLGAEVLESGSSDILSRIYPMLDVVGINVRTVTQQLGGYLFVVNHAAGTREKDYGPGLKWKPRLARTLQHEVDAEFFLGKYQDAPKTLLCSKAAELKPNAMPLIVADARRQPEAIGNGCIITFDHDVAEAAVTAEEEDEGATRIYNLKPGSEEDRVFKFRVVVPKLVCGPKMAF